MEISISASHAITTKVTDLGNDPGGNRASFEIEFTADSGQDFIVNNEEVSSVKFTIVGGFELSGFFETIAEIKKRIYVNTHDREMASLYLPKETKNGN